MLFMMTSVALFSACSGQGSCPDHVTTVYSRPATDGGPVTDCKTACVPLTTVTTDSCSFVTLPDGGPGMSCSYTLLCL
jgi:hypothetical protein